MEPRVTLSDVAHAAGVSQATASRAINGSANRVVGAKLRERVLAAAAQLGYAPDANAQAMARGRTTSLGLVVHDIADPYYASIAAGVTLEADAEGLLVTLADTRFSSERETEIVRMLDRQRVVAIVLAGTRLGEAVDDNRLVEALRAYAHRGGQVATVAQALSDLPAVRIDNAGAAKDLTRQLVELGYRRFGVVAGPPVHRTARERVEAISDELARLSLPLRPDMVVPADLTREGGSAAAAVLLGRAQRPDVVMACTDLVAIGVLAAARDLGLRVPDDVAVSGFDDIDVASDVTPPLTTVRLPLAEVGRLATRLALDRSGARSGHLVVGEVVLRASTPPRATAD